MAASTIKKVIVRRFHRENLNGFVNPVTYLQPNGVELMSESAQVSIIPYEETKYVAFVREFEDTEEARPVFQTRPKMIGLWVSLRFRDNEVIEGILPNNLLQIEHHGFVVTPPDPFGNQQRLFVPRSALASVEVLGVVGSPLQKRKPKSKPAPEGQGSLFDQ